MQENKKSSLLLNVPLSASSFWQIRSKFSISQQWDKPLTSTALSAEGGASILSLISAAVTVCFAWSLVNINSQYLCVNVCACLSYLELYGLLLFLLLVTPDMASLLWDPEQSRVVIVRNLQEWVCPSGCPSKYRWLKWCIFYLYISETNCLDITYHLLITLRMPKNVWQKFLLKRQLKLWF